MYRKEQVASLRFGTVIAAPCRDFNFWFRFEVHSESSQGCYFLQLSTLLDMTTTVFTQSHCQHAYHQAIVAQP